MSRRRFSAVLLALLFLFYPVFGFAEMDSWLQMLEGRTGLVDPEKSWADPVLESCIAFERDAVTGVMKVGVIIEMEDADVPAPRVSGMTIGSRIGEIVTARVPIDRLRELEAAPGVRRVAASKIYHSTMDIAVPDANVNDVWNGSPAYTGSGVLVGVIDTGIDWTHDDFRNADGTTRIKAIFDQYGTGTPPSGYTYGVEYTESQINASLSGSSIVHEVDTGGHGTHVAGTAAGNGRAATGNPYRGVAYEANIVFAKAESPEGGFAEDKTIDAMNYMVQKAQSLGKPITINMSLGGHFGAHTGQEYQEKVLNRLSGPGVVFCVSAGNEGVDKIHTTVTVPSDTLILTIDQYQPQGANADFVVVHIWVDGSTSPGVSVAGPPFVPSGDQSVYQSTYGTIEIYNATASQDTISGYKRIQIILSDYHGTDPATGNWPIAFQGGSGVAHAWIANSNIYGAGFSTSDNSYSLGEPGTAEKAVTVAAYKTRNCWPSLQGQSCFETYPAYAGSEGERIGFSSIGPTRDGREKPDVIAPGAKIVSVLSKDYQCSSPNTEILPGDKYIGMQGTSMSSPFVCGVVALMFEKNPALTADEVRSYLRSSARTDTYTGTTWNARYGAGKVDAAAVIAALPGGSGIIRDGNVNDDGAVNVLDLVTVVNYIIDPTGHPLTTDQRNRADVYPAGSPDGTINVSDLARIVSFVLGTESPKRMDAAPSPIVFAIDEAVLEDDLWWVPISIAGDGIAAFQFALTLNDGEWSPHGIRSSGLAPSNLVSRRCGSQIRVLAYDHRNDLPDHGIVIRVPYEPQDGSSERPRLSGLLIVDAHGDPFDVDVHESQMTGFGPRILGALPNPTRGAAKIGFELGVTAEVHLAVYDVRGRLVRVLGQGPWPAGRHSVTWDGCDASGRRAPVGVYFCRLSTAGETKSMKLVLAK